MVQPLPASQYLHHSLTDLPASTTSSSVQQLVHDPQSRTSCGACGADTPGARKPCPSRTSHFCFSSEFNARSTLRRDNPVASITALILVAPPATARATSEVALSIFLLLFFLLLQCLDGLSRAPDMRSIHIPAIDRLIASPCSRCHSAGESIGAQALF